MEGYKLRYVNPVTGGYPMPSMGAFCNCCQERARVWRGAPTALSTTSLKGQGEVTIGNEIFIFAKDILWRRHGMVSFRSSEDGVIQLFGQAVQEALGLFRKRY